VERVEHDPVIVYGDTRPVSLGTRTTSVSLIYFQENILIDNSGNPRITDIGERTVFESLSLSRCMINGFGMPLWYDSPELVNDEQRRPTKESDVYAYAMTCYVVLASKVPFPDRDDTEIPESILLNLRPSRPKEGEDGTIISDRFWSLMEECWDRDATKRPTMRQMSKELTYICELADSKMDTDETPDLETMETIERGVASARTGPMTNIQTPISKRDRTVFITFTNHGEDKILFEAVTDGHGIPPITLLPKQRWFPIRLRYNTPLTYMLQYGKKIDSASLKFKRDQEFDLSRGIRQFEGL